MCGLLEPHGLNTIPDLASQLGELNESDRVSQNPRPRSPKLHSFSDLSQI